MKQCPGCLTQYNEIQFLREMIKNLMDKQLLLMNDTLVPKIQGPASFSPIAINDNGKMVKMDDPEKAAEELTFTDAEPEVDVVNEVMGH